MDPKQYPNPGGNRMEQYGRITIDREYTNRKVNMEALTASIVRIMVASGIGAVGIVFFGILKIAGSF